MEDEMQLDLTDDNLQKNRYMTFRAGKELYGISIRYVSEIIGIQEITLLPEVESYIKGLINLRGKIIPVVDVRICFGLMPIEYTDRTCIIVLETKTTVIGLIVEQIAEVDTIPEENILSPPALGHKGYEYEYKKYIYGIAKVGEQETARESVRLLIDPEKLLGAEDAETIASLENAV